MRRFDICRVMAAQVLFLCCSVSAMAQSNSGPMRGALKISVYVKGPNGGAAPIGINVRLEGDPGGLVDQQMTDSSGKVTFLPKDFTRYVVIVRERGYREEIRPVDLSNTPTAGVSITLVSVPESEDRKLAPAPASGGSISAGNLNVPEAARKEFDAGQKLFQVKHDATGSIGHYQKAIKLYDGFTQAHLMLGLAYLQDHKLKESQAELERAIQLDDKSGASYLTLGANLNQQKDYTGAEKALLRGLELNPESPEGHYELAKAYWAQRRWQEARPHAEKAEKLQPDQPGVHVLMGNILLQSHENEQAIKEFNEYLRLEPEGPMSKGVRDMIKKLESTSTPK
jgi:Tfp pilus assembly protein PilF